MKAQMSSLLPACAAVLALASGGSTALHAAAPRDSAAVTQLFQKDLAGIPGKEVVLARVEYVPGGASAPHRHDANVLVYVLEGELEMQVEGQPPVRLGPGQTFYESPDDVHLKSANASAVAPARFLAFVVKDKDRPVSRAVSPQH
jgi:quercetin dioxygenase-like cupin family protein